ncbi:hypothetical protein EQ826_00155 [Ectopseudomonas mendocina]|nr:hypothetical protein [Pseudomonas mendocina]TRO21972.1 hypothetical protein EQ828_12860 [Pseudomonas mendocina]TRO29338.1 hypothetical protein EQ826_00155 [Pseudomonas mendocina]
MTEWQPAATAPLDRVILADTGYPWPVLAVWSDYCNGWVTAELQASLCEGKADPAWISEREGELLAWMDLPGVSRG